MHVHEQDAVYAQTPPRALAAARPSMRGHDAVHARTPPPARAETATRLSVRGHDAVYAPTPPPRPQTPTRVSMRGHDRVHARHAAVLGWTRLVYGRPFAGTCACSG